MKATNTEYLGAKWKQKRAHILKQAAYQCQWSKRFGRTLNANTVHHIYPLEDYPQYAYCDWNLIAVDAAVHGMMHVHRTGKLSKIGMELMRGTIPPTQSSIF